MRHVVARFRQQSFGGYPAPDAALAVIVCAISVASVLTGNPAEGSLAVTLPVAVVTTLALLWRRREPIVAVGLTLAAGLLQTLLAQPPGSLWSLLVYVIVMYSVAAWSSEGVAAVGGAVFVAALLLQERIGNGVDYLFILLVFGGVWLLGRASRTWRGRVAVAEQRQREAARLATVEERLRIARDLHDVVAHSLGAIAIQADAAEAALGAAPERALAPVQAISGTARSALADIRQMLDLLRDDPSPDSAAAARDFKISTVEELVASARATGVPAELDTRGDVHPIPSTVGDAVYRVVQESLTNVRKHAAGAPTRVSIVNNGRAIVVRVSNGPYDRASTSACGGYGIRGMRERARALGGTVTAGPTADGGFEVHAVLPIANGRQGAP